MQNPMTPTEMKQAIDDIDAGCDMESKSLRQPELGWHSRGTNGGEPNFSDYQYRRKPELMERFVNVYKNGEQSMWETFHFAKKHRGEGFVRCIRLVEDPTWTEPVEEETNPWRPIVKGEWPECKPGDRITLRWERVNVQKQTLCAHAVAWATTNAIEWRYAEDE